jgi:anti-sigma factor RsiW
MNPKCQEMEASFAPYVDGEATPDQRASLDAHLAACPPCRGRLAEEQAAREVLRARRDRVRPCATEALRARCAAHAASGGSRFLGRRAIVPLSLAATLVLAVAGVLLFSVTNPIAALAATLSVDHVKCFELNADERASDAPAAARQWRDTRGWSIGVPPGAEAESLELLGVRPGRSSDGFAAHLMYRWRGEPLSVYIIPKTIPGVTATQRGVEKLGHGAVIWSSGPRTYLVMRRGRTDGLDGVIAYIRRHVE